MKKIIFLSQNKIKIASAEKNLGDLPIELVFQKVDTPEIQSDTNEDIAKFSARWAAKELQTPVILTDAGYYVPALNGFPGPFIKWVGRWLSADLFLKLMAGIEDRRVEAKETLAFCEPGKEPVTFAHTWHGTIAIQPGAKGDTWINSIYIPDGYDRPITELATNDDFLNYWRNGASHYQSLRKYLEENFI